jgi:hypothetical protein
LETSNALNGAGQLGWPAVVTVEGVACAQQPNPLSAIGDEVNLGGVVTGVDSRFMWWVH